MLFTIKPQNRMGWDLFLMVVIFFVAFEVPYDIFVGWENKATKSIGSSLFRVGNGMKADFHNLGV